MKYRPEFEETFADLVLSSGKENSKLEVPISRKTPYLFFLIIALTLAFFWIRTAWLSVLEGEQLSLVAQKNTERIFPILAPRGIVYDRNGETLVENIPSFRIVIDSSRMPKDEDVLTKQLTDISNSLRISLPQINDKLTKAQNTPYFILARDISQESAVELSLIQLKDDIVWMSIESFPERVYKDSEHFSHVLGYTGEVTKEDIESNSGYFLTEEIGKTGIEFSYDNVLRGIAGENVFVVDSRGRTDKNFIEREAKSGNNLKLTIDSELQKVLSISLAKETKKAGAKSGAAVALDPRDGSVRALVSYPSFDNNIFARGISVEDYAEFTSDKSKPLLNRVVGGLYPAGSTIKPMVGLAALQEKVITSQKRISDPGFITVSNIYNPSIIYTYNDWKAHGTVNFIEAIAESCDVYFYTVGGGYKDIKGLGINRLAYWLSEFNIDKKTGIDIPGELSGLVPTPEWKEKEKGESWVLGNTYHVSIGQGDLLLTPLELATAISAIVNNGNIYKPRLVDSIFENKDRESKVGSQIVKHVEAQQEYFDLVKRGMRSAVTSSVGTAKTLQDVKVAVAAKTGTAQVGSKRTHAWMTAFAPYENPELVIVTLIEHGGEGSVAAAPVVKAGMDAYFEE